MKKFTGCGALQIAILIGCLLMISSGICAQDSMSVSGQDLDKYLTKWYKQSQNVRNRIEKKSTQVLAKFNKHQQRILRKLSRIDSAAAFDLSGFSGKRFLHLRKDLEGRLINGNDRMIGEYLPYLDSMKGSLNFLVRYGGKFTGSITQSKLLTHSLQEIRQVETSLRKAELIKTFVQERQRHLQAILGRYGRLPRSIRKEFMHVRKEVYYYKEQIRAYKEMFREPEKAREKVLAIANKFPAYREFMEKNSMLAGLFGLSGPGSYTANANGTGLQTRSQLISAVQGNLGVSNQVAGSMIQRNVQSVQAQVDGLRTRIADAGGNGGDLNMPQFKPNSQRTRSFFQRLELGTNLQTVKSNNFFPSTTDLGLSLGYRLNDKNSIGLGMSYKIGWGSNIRNINITSEGVGFRSFLDINIKKTFFASGGFEYNYQKPFNSLAGLYDLDDWKRSGLIGVSKIVSMKTKLFKKTKIQILWDFLSASQLPRTQPLKFRVGYNF